MSKTITKRQHYVWRYYLKQWATKDQIWCLKNGERLFPSSLMGVANEKYFYEIEKFTECEKNYLLCFIRETMHPTVREHCVKFALKFISNSGKINWVENYYAKIENSSIRFYESLYQKEASFIKNDDCLLYFLIFLFEQYFRTKRNEESIKAQFVSVGLPFFVKFFAVLRHIYAKVTAQGGLANKNNYDFKLLKNESPQPFITGDQPVVNINRAKTTPNEESEHLDLYYPLTPTLALLLIHKEHVSKHSESIDDETFINQYNSFIFEESHSQVYAKNKENLKLFAELQHDGSKV